jgi:hypothetical protein
VVEAERLHKVHADVRGERGQIARGDRPHSDRPGSKRPRSERPIGHPVQLAGTALLRAAASISAALAVTPVTSEVISARPSTCNPFGQ